MTEHTDRLDRGRAQLLEAMSAVSEDRTCCGWAFDWARTLHAEGGIWETLGRAVGWPTGNYDAWVWVSWEEAAELYGHAAVVVRVPDTSHTVREQLLDALDFSYCLGLGFETPEMLLAAYDASRTVPHSPADRAAVCICGHTEQQHFEDVCITEITGCDCGDFILPDAAREVIARWREAATQRTADRAAVLREAIDVAREEGHRLEEVSGIKAARGARSVAYLLRRLLVKAQAAVPAAVSGRTDNETGATPVAASGPRANAAASAVGGAQPKEAGA